MGVLRCGIPDEIADELEHVRIAADVVEGVIAVGTVQVYQVKNADV